MRVEDVLDMKLVENYEVEHGGLDHLGETVGEFLDSLGRSKDDTTIGELNEMLIECGIMPIENEWTENGIHELKEKIAEAAVRLMDLLDECPDLDFIDDVVEAVKYNEAYRISDYLY